MNLTRVMYVWHGLPLIDFIAACLLASVFVLLILPEREDIKLFDVSHWERNFFLFCYLLVSWEE